MQKLLNFFEGVDTVNRKFANLADYMVLIGVLISAGNAAMRYLFSISSNAYLEIQWFTFVILVLGGSAYVLRINEHVRVDIIYSGLSNRKKIWVDTLGLIFFLLPATILLTWLCARFAYFSVKDLEGSMNSGGLPVWPIKLFFPLGFFMLTLQGFSELVKRIAALSGMLELNAHYEKPLQ